MRRERSIDLNLGRQFDAYQDFVLGCKLYWTHEIYGALRAEYERRQRGAPTPPRSADEAEALLEDDTLYRYYAWLERHLQRFKYSGRLGLVPAHEPHRAGMEDWLDQDLPEGLLALDDGLELPRYFTAVDIHQHPGGVWSDALAGVVYERASRSTTPLIAKHRDLHYRFTALVESHRRPRRIVDLGCGFGKSTRPFYSEHRDAQVVGVDIAAPCLKLAAICAAEDQAGNVRYLQARAERTGLEEEAYDVVTSTMLIHEMPPAAVEAVFAESYRLLEPGGYAIHLDFLADDDPFNRFVHYGHARRNNEPYMPPLNEMDVVGVHRALGYRSVEVKPFEEMPGALAPGLGRWRFPWAVVIAQK